MAAVSVQDSVTFTDTSTENIRYAKEFWKSIDGNFDEKSSLFVPGVDHQLHTASWNIKRSKATEKVQHTNEEPGLVSHRNEANRRLKVEEEEYVHRVLDQRKQQQDIMKRRKNERLAKENVRESRKETFVEELLSFDADDDKKYMEDEGLQAMKDIDNFDRMVKISNEQRKEKHIDHDNKL